MDDSWVQHVTAILDYLEGRTQAPNTQTQQSARDLMTSLDAWSFIGSASHYGLQVRALTILQRLAYYDADRGAIRDIASWVLERWLRMLQCYPRSVSGLQGVGSWWLSRAQPSLARIHAVDGSSSGSEGSRKYSGTSDGPRSADDEQAQREAEARLGTPDYVEARGILQPATDYLRRAVDEAQSQGNLTWHLLVMAAEAYMSFGNVSSARVGEGLFRQTVYYLRQAADMQTLPAHLQRWLDDFGRFVD